jgi:hypothetical protein
MKEKLLAIITFLFTACFLTPFVNAQTTIPNRAPNEKTTLNIKEIDNTEALEINLTNLFGQDHKYSVYLKDNNEAIILLLATISNQSSKPLSQIELKSKNGILNPSAFQVIREPYCTQYANPNVINSKCLEYTEPDYFSFYSEKTHYLKAETSIEDDTIEITLPKAIAPNKAGSYLFAFTTKDLIKNRLGGAKEYTFNSLTTDAQIQNMQIGFSSQTNKRFRESPFSVDQVTKTYESTSILSGAQRSELGKFRSSQFDFLISSIGWGTVNKNATYISPNETYITKGSFAPSLFSLFFNEILIFTLIIIFIIAILIFSIIFLGRKTHTKTDLEKMSKSNISLTSKDIIVYILLSFFFSTMTAITISVLLAIRNWFDYWSYYQLTTSAVFILTVKGALILQFLFYAPLLYIGFKKSFKKAVLYFSTYCVFIFIYVLIAALYFSTSSIYTPPAPYPPYPIMKMDSVSAPDEAVTIPSSEKIEDVGVY